jgi:hypothetical protein
MLELHSKSAGHTWVSAEILRWNRGRTKEHAGFFCRRIRRLSSRICAVVSAESNGPARPTAANRSGRRVRRCWAGSTPETRSSERLLQEHPRGPLSSVLAQVRKFAGSAGSRPPASGRGLDAGGSRVPFVVRAAAVQIGRESVAAMLLSGLMERQHSLRTAHTAWSCKAADRCVACNQSRNER